MKYCIFILLFVSFFSFAEFKELGKNPDLLKTEKVFSFKTTPIKVVQKRWLDKKWLSEVSVSVSPIFNGLNYMDSQSVDLSYRLFFNDYFSLNAKAYYYFNSINQDGKTEVTKYGLRPVELIEYPRWSYTLGLDWYPFYGKAVLYNQLLSFDFYLSLLAGQIQLKQQKRTLYSLGLGQVHWWNQRFNTRLELKAFYFKYSFLQETQPELLYSLSLSAGVLF